MHRLLHIIIMPRQTQTTSASSIYHAILRGVNKQQVIEDEEIWQLLSALCGASNATEFQAIPRPQQKLHLFAVHEEGVDSGTLSRLTGFLYSVVQGQSVTPSVMAAWCVSPFPKMRNMKPTLKIRNMRSTQYINMGGGPAEPVPLTLRGLLMAYNLPFYVYCHISVF